MNTPNVSHVRTYIGMGANLDDPIQQVVDARQRLANWQYASFSQCSSMYVSSPVGYAEQADFVNCVLELHTLASAQDLLLFMQSIETQLGRVRDVTNQNAPRKIDLDLLIYGDSIIRDANLEVPHPRMNQRLFVMQPLAELGVEVNADAGSDFSQQIVHKLVC